MLGCPDCGCKQVRITMPEGWHPAYTYTKEDRDYQMMIDCPQCGRIEKYPYTEEVWIDGKKTYATRNMRFN